MRSTAASNGCSRYRNRLPGYADLSYIAAILKYGPQSRLIDLCAHISDVYDLVRLCLQNISAKLAIRRVQMRASSRYPDFAEFKNVPSIKHGA